MTTGPTSESWTDDFFGWMTASVLKTLVLIRHVLLIWWSSKGKCCKWPHWISFMNFHLLILKICNGRPFGEAYKRLCIPCISIRPEQEKILLFLFPDSFLPIIYIYILRVIHISLYLSLCWIDFCFITRSIFKSN